MFESFGGPSSQVMPNQQMVFAPRSADQPELDFLQPLRPQPKRRSTSLRPTIPTGGRGVSKTPDRRGIVQRGAQKKKLSAPPLKSVLDEFKLLVGVHPTPTTDPAPSNAADSQRDVYGDTSGARTDQAAPPQGRVLGVGEQSQYNGTWVTAYGFDAGHVAVVLGELQRAGEIVRHGTFGAEGNARWVDVQFTNKYAAQRALQLNHKRLSSGVYLGVMPQPADHAQRVRDHDAQQPAMNIDVGAQSTGTPYGNHVIDNKLQGRDVPRQQGGLWESLAKGWIGTTLAHSSVR